jgi:hypothetical protein
MADESSMPFCDDCRELSIDQLCSDAGITLGHRADLKSRGCRLCLLIDQAFLDYIELPSDEVMDAPSEDETVRIWARLEEVDSRLYGVPEKLAGLDVASGAVEGLDAITMDTIRSMSRARKNGSSSKGVLSRYKTWFERGAQLWWTHVRFSAWKGR